ncbi:MAG: response regulator, partial [Hyphomicrobium sp.]|nr:response regulator [Hyphomicrobium sp.]
MRVLVADDNVVNRRMIRMLLGALGHTVDVVEDGALACLATQTQVYDVVLLDLNMPVMDGREAVVSMRARGKPAPRLIIVTADNTAESYAACMAAGADGVETKPLDLAKLSSIMAETASALM